MQLLTNEEFLPCALSLISNAQKSIDISTFKAELITKPRGRSLVKLFDKIIEKSRLGVTVRFLVSIGVDTEHIPRHNLYTALALKKTKVQVRQLPISRICHAKIIIVDGWCAIIGSHNLSVKSCHSNFECSMYFQDPKTVNHLSNVFTKTFESARGY